MNRFIRDCLISGVAGGLLSHVVSAVCSRAEHGPGRARLPMHAVSHIAWNDDPDSPRGVAVTTG